MIRSMEAYATNCLCDSGPAFLLEASQLLLQHTAAVVEVAWTLRSRLV